MYGKSKFASEQHFSSLPANLGCELCHGVVATFFADRNFENQIPTVVLEQYGLHGFQKTRPCKNIYKTEPFLVEICEPIQEILADFTISCKS